LSGGLRQRALIALALACNPALVIADEPTTALDVTIQAQILDLLRDLQRRLGLALLLITHDLGIVAEMADRVAVMYAGRIVEEAPVRELFRDPRHPYTRGLLASIPGGARGSKLQAIHGTVPPIGDLPPGCAFAPRCPNRFEPCDVAPPGVTVILPPKGGSHVNSVEEGGSRVNSVEEGGSQVNSVEEGGSHVNSVEEGGSRVNSVEEGGSHVNSVEEGGSRVNSVEEGGSRVNSLEGSRGFRLQAEDHTARCFLYSPAIDPEVLPEVKR
jgi:oligopeptide/dipeptide ABC transporter ATP-binding protein